jgi:hypothetical protein
MSITWQISVNGTGYQALGTTNHLTYITWAPSVGTKTRQTFVQVGCSAAKGTGGTTGTDDQKVLAPIWGAMQGLSTTHMHGVKLTYYAFLNKNGNGTWDGQPPDGNFNTTTLCMVTDAYGLVANGNGQCHTWADFMNCVLKAQGLDNINGTANQKTTITPNTVTFPAMVFFAINKWATAGASPWKIISFDAGVDGAPDSVGYSGKVPVNGQAADLKGAPGQGTSPNPPSKFPIHYILHLNTAAGGKPAVLAYHDPSYGVFAPDTATYENSALFGVVNDNKTLLPLPLAGTICIYNDGPPPP